jgi:hypothetical protein
VDVLEFYRFLITLFGFSSFSYSIACNKSNISYYNLNDCHHRYWAWSDHLFESTSTMKIAPSKMMYNLYSLLSDLWDPLSAFQAGYQMRMLYLHSLLRVTNGLLVVSVISYSLIPKELTREKIDSFAL